MCGGLAVCMYVCVGTSLPPPLPMACPANASVAGSWVTVTQSVKKAELFNWPSNGYNLNENCTLVFVDYLRTSIKRVCI